MSQGMEMEAKQQPDDAKALFLQAWNEATNDFEKLQLLIMLPDVKNQLRTN